MTAAPPPAYAVVLPAGRAHAVLRIREPSGVILENRLVVPRGAVVTATGSLRRLAGVRVTSGDTTICRRHGARDVCTQPEEWCPMPRAVWRFVVAKRAGPAMTVTMRFVVGAPPR